MTIRFPSRASVALVALALATGAQAQIADIAISSNDGHSVMQNGTPVAGSAADSLVVIDLSGAPKVLSTVAVPGSVVGPPTAVALTRDGRFVIVTSATKLDPQDKTKNIPDTRAFVVDLAASKIVGEVETGLAPASVALSPDNTLALIANRNEGTVSVFKWGNGALAPLGKIDTGNPKSNPSGLLFLPDGKAALLSRDGDNIVNVLRVDGETVTIDKRPLTTGVRPYTMALSGSGRHAAVSNMGRGDGDTDTVSLIDISREPFRVVDSIAVGALPEGIRFSPDGAYLAIVAQEGSTKPKASPFATDGGQLVMLAVEGNKMRRAADARIGHWSQGAAFSRDGKTVLVQNMVERTISFFAWDGSRLKEGAPLQFDNGPAAITTPWP